MSNRKLFDEGKKHVIEKLKQKGYEVIDMHEDNPKCPYHLLINKKIKIEIKTSRPYLTKNSDWYYHFSLSSLYERNSKYFLKLSNGRYRKKLDKTCHFVIFIGFSDNEKDIYIVPSNRIGTKIQTIKIPSNPFTGNRFLKYSERWGLIEVLIDKTA